MVSREKITSSLIEALRIKGFADAFEKLMYLVAAVLGVCFFFFIINLMGVNNFLILTVVFAGLAVVKGLFVLMIK
ncbi:MAG: hypothetical protein OTJ97_02765 [SAR202 cluster bacterium]|nr:hypothetical protein [SAR202 cluster bacterium]